MKVKLPDGTVIDNVPEGTTQAQLYARLQANGYDVAKLSNASRTGVNDLETIARDKAERDKLAPESGVLVNLGAGMNNVYQGVKQLFGKGETDAQIEERRKINDMAAEGQWGGGATQMLGEMLMGAPIGMGASSAVAKGLTMLPKVGAYISELGGVGGRAVNLGGVGRGAVEGGSLASLNPVTEDESRLLNTTVGTFGGAAIPGVLTAGNVLRKTLNKSNAGNRAAKIFEEQLGPNNVHDINFKLDVQPKPNLPLSTAASTENATLAALERGARARNTGDMGYNQSRNVANQAWSTVRGATTQADDLANRVADREAIIEASKQHLDQFNDPNLLNSATQLVSDTADALRRTPVARQNPEVTTLLGRTEQMLSHPERTAGDYASQYWRLTDELNNPATSTEARGVIMKMRQAVQEAADEASGGTSQFTDMVERYKVDEAHVGAAQAAKGVRESFMDPLGIPKTPQTYGDTPSITSAALRKSMVKNGANPYGDVLEPSTRTSLKDLESELTRHEMSSAANSPGVSQLDIVNPLNVVSSGRDNPFNYFPLVKGGANWLFSGARKATTESADQAMMDPAAWQRMMTEYAASKSPLTRQEYMSRALRKSTMLPGDAMATQIGE